MAHYVAELISGVESETGDQKQLAEKKCFDTILTLWKHRAELPDGKRPFEDLEPIVRTIASLDPNDNTPRFFHSVRPLHRQGEEKTEADRWLALVRSLDISAKILIGYCLAEAARAAVDKSEEWVKLAEAAGATDSPFEIVIRFISDNADLGNEPDPIAEVRQQLQERIRRLEDFINQAEAVVDDLKTRLV